MKYTIQTNSSDESLQKFMEFTTSYLESNWSGVQVHRDTS